MDRLRDLLGEDSSSHGGTVALFVDGPNVLRDEFDVDLDDIREVAVNTGLEATGNSVQTNKTVESGLNREGDNGESGLCSIACLYLDEHAPPKLIQAAEARGYDVRVTSGDVDVKLAVDATELLLLEHVDVLAIASRDTDFKPVLEKAARCGVYTLAIAPGEHGRSDALQNVADKSVVLGE